MSLWEERAGRNEALFREVNEQMERLGRDWQQPAEPHPFVCECADEACTDRIAVPSEVYRDVRSEPRRFLVRPGHEQAEIERVITATDDYAVVEKTGVAAQIAERTAPSDG